MTAGGYIRLDRALLNWRWIGYPEMVALWVIILLSANFKDGTFKDMVIPRGSFVTSYQSLSNTSKLSVQTVRTCIKRLISTGEITINTTNKFSVITVQNYDYYQTDNKQTNKQLTNKQQTTNKQLTTIEKEEKRKKNKKNNISCSYDIEAAVVKANTTVPTVRKRK